jgi:hypothetical protein
VKAILRPTGDSIFGFRGAGCYLVELVGRAVGPLLLADGRCRLTTEDRGWRRLVNCL